MSTRRGSLGMRGAHFWNHWPSGYLCTIRFNIRKNRTLFAQSACVFCCIVLV